jgi:hypothetical protein
MRRAFCVEVIVFTAAAAIMSVRTGDLQNLNASILQISQQTCAVATRAFYPDTLYVAEGTHPGQHQAISLPRGGKALCTKNPILVIYDRCDMQIFVGIDATDDVGWA